MPRTSKTPNVKRRRFDQHYCRLCDTAYERKETGETPSPHMLIAAHLRVIHHTTASAVCDRGCQESEQPEEAKQKRRIYGPGAQTLTPIQTYETLLGPED